MTSCSICDDEVTEKNPLFVCVACDIKIHKFCYGISEPQKNWKCSPCRKGQTSFVKCQLCLQKGGPMKKTECNRWVHVICALFTHNVKFLNENTMEPIDLSNLSTSKRKKLCSFCYTSHGFCSTCSEKKCKVTFHITCAQKFKLLREDIDPNDDSIKFNAYCKDHMPNDTGRRLSSGSVQSIVSKKHAKELKSKGTKEDGDWILNEIQKHSTPITSRKRSGKQKTYAMDVLNKHKIKWSFFVLFNSRRQRCTSNIDRCDEKVKKQSFSHCQFVGRRFQTG